MRDFMCDALGVAAIFGALYAMMLIGHGVGL